MARLTQETVKYRVMDILPVGEGFAFETQLDIIVSAAISKLRHEGVPINAKYRNGEPFFTDGTGENEEESAMNGNDYIMCIGYQVLKDLDFTDVDMNFLTEQYITRVNTIRCGLLTQY